MISTTRLRYASRVIKAIPSENRVDVSKSATDPPSVGVALPEPIPAAVKKAMGRSEVRVSRPTFLWRLIPVGEWGHNVSDAVHTDHGLVTVWSAGMGGPRSAKGTSATAAATARLGSHRCRSGLPRALVARLPECVAGVDVSGAKSGAQPLLTLCGRAVRERLWVHGSA